MLSVRYFPNLVFTSVLFTAFASVVYSTPSRAEQSIPKPAFKLPETSCIVGARFLTAAGSELSGLIEFKIEFTRIDEKSAASTQTVELGHGVSLIMRTTYLPKGSMEKAGAAMLIVNSKVARRNADGKFTVLASAVTTSDTDYQKQRFLSTASNFQNPEVETALLNNSVTSRGELVRRNLLPAKTFDSALLTCNSLEGSQL